VPCLRLVRGRGGGEGRLIQEPENGGQVQGASRPDHLQAFGSQEENGGAYLNIPIYRSERGNKETIRRHGLQDALSAGVRENRI